MKVLPKSLTSTCFQQKICHTLIATFQGSMKRSPEIPRRKFFLLFFVFPTRTQNDSKHESYCLSFCIYILLVQILSNHVWPLSLKNDILSTLCGFFIVFFVAFFSFLCLSKHLYLSSTELDTDRLHWCWPRLSAEDQRCPSARCRPQRIRALALPGAFVAGDVHGFCSHLSEFSSFSNEDLKNPVISVAF